MDPTTNPTLQHAIELIRIGDRQRASIVLAKYLKDHPDSEHGWHILSYALIDQEQQIYALKRALRINPGNIHVKTRLEQLSPQPAEPAPPPIAPEQPPSPTPRAQPALGVENDALTGDLDEILESPLADSQTSRKSLIQSVSPVTEPQHPATLVVSKPIPAPIIERSLTPQKYGMGHRIRTRAIIAWRRFKMNWGIFAQSPLAIFGLVLIFFFGLMAIAFPILINSVWPRGIYDPFTGFDMNVFPHPSAPGPGHLLGTDSLGRDVLSMILAATTPTFLVGLTAAFSTALVGTTLSVTAAYFRGKIDAIITNLADVFLLFPAPIIMVIIGARYRDLGPMPLGLIYGVVTGAGATTIVMRAQAIQIASKPFMEAAHIAGGGPFHIITKHLIPSVMPLAALQMMIAVTGAVVADGFISFFGLTRTVSNWGTIIYDAFIYGNLTGSYGQPWHMLIPSAACFSLFALGFYLVSRGLHRVASPSLREE